VSFSVGVFISHSWANSGHYDTLSSWIFGESWNVDGTPVEFFNSSVPKDNPIHYAATDDELNRRIRERISNANVIVCPTGMYSSHSKWIAKELDAARDLRRSIVGVNPWAQARKSAVVQEVADITVGWSKKSVVNAIWGNRQIG
jgi:hypothetical protein